MPVTPALWRTSREWQSRVASVLACAPAHAHTHTHKYKFSCLSSRRTEPIALGCPLIYLPCCSRGQWPSQHAHVLRSGNSLQRRQWGPCPLAVTRDREVIIGMGLPDSLPSRWHGTSPPLLPILLPPASDTGKPPRFWICFLANMNYSFPSSSLSLKWRGDDFPLGRR